MSQCLWRFLPLRDHDTYTEVLATVHCRRCLSMPIKGLFKGQPLLCGELWEPFPIVKELEQTGQHGKGHTAWIPGISSLFLLPCAWGATRAPGQIPMQNLSASSPLPHAKMWRPKFPGKRLGRLEKDPGKISERARGKHNCPTREVDHLEAVQIRVAFSDSRHPHFR